LKSLRKLQPARSLNVANTFQSTTIFISQSCRFVKLKLLDAGLLYKYYTNIGLQYITKICIEKPNNQNFHPTAFRSEISIDQDSSVKLKTKRSVKVLLSKFNSKIILYGLDSRLRDDNPHLIFEHPTLDDNTAICQNTKC